MSNRRSRVVLIVLVVVLIGTSAGIGVLQAVGGDERAFDESIPFKEDGQPLTHVDRLESIAEANPGFGGYFVDPDDGTIVTILMTDVGESQIAERSAASVLGADRYISQVKVAKAEFLYTDLAEWFRLINEEVVPEIADVLVSWSIREDQNRIEINVSDPEMRVKVIRLLEKNGIPLQAVVIEVSPDFDH